MPETCYTTAMRKPCVKSILLLVWERDVSARDFLAGFAHYANSRRNWRVRLLHAADALMPDTVESIVSGQYDGLVLTDTFFKRHPEFARCPATAITIIGSDKVRLTPPVGRFARVCVDNQEIGRVGAQHLMGLGRFNSYAFIPPPISEDWDSQRAFGFSRELLRNRLACAVYDRALPLADWLRGLSKPAAVMAACDYTAIEAMSACANLSLRIPEDISILGVDNDELLCEFAQPSLTSIQPKHFASGFRAAQALNGLFQNRSAAGRRTKAVFCSGAKVIERESTHPLSPALHLIHAATAYIKANVRNDISVTDVVNHLGVSRRLADLRFHEHHNMSILDAILDAKLTELGKRLMTTKLPVGQVAATLGFHDLSYVGRLFRKRYGMTMSQWRGKSRIVRRQRPGWAE